MKLVRHVRQARIDPVPARRIHARADHLAVMRDVYHDTIRVRLLDFISIKTLIDFRIRVENAVSQKSPALTGVAPTEPVRRSGRTRVDWRNR